MDGLDRVYLGKVPGLRHDFGTTSALLRHDFDTTSTRIQGHKLIVYSIIWAEPAKAQAEA